MMDKPPQLALGSILAFELTTVTRVANQTVS